MKTSYTMKSLSEAVREVNKRNLADRTTLWTVEHSYGIGWYILNNKAGA
jgi:hypothetical protein